MTGPPTVAGSRTVTVTPLKYATKATGAPINFSVLGISKHLTVAYLNGRHYKVFGDHAGTDPQLPGAAPMVGQGGRQEIYSFSLPANDWRQDQPYYIKDPTQIQFAFPDDGWACVRNDEVWVMCGATNYKTNPPYQPPGYAVQTWGVIMAWKPGVGWRQVANPPRTRMDMGGNACWGALWDSVRDYMIIPCLGEGLVFDVIRCSDGADLTQRTSTGTPYQYGNHDFHVAGMCLRGRTAYCYDHTTCELWSINVDTIPGSPSMTLLAILPDAKQAAEGQAKIVYHPDTDSIVVAATRFHIYEPTGNKLTSIDRPDGFLNKDVPPKWILPSTIFYDPPTKDLVSVGGIDWDTAFNPGVFWQLHIA